MKESLYPFMKTLQEEKNPPAPSSNQHLVAGLGGFASFKQLRGSEFYRQHQQELKRLLDEPKIYESADAQPRLQSFLRVVEWNIERGSRLEGIVEVLNTHPVIRFADLLLLNELDVGMARSGNRDIPRELGQAVSAHAIYAAEYLELTKGVGDELKLAGENTAALHGNAILTRHNFARAEVARLPRCEMNFESEEKRLGGRVAIMVDLEIGDHKLLAATAHLDVINTPRCRAKQMRAFLEAVDGYAKASRAPGRAVVGGDLNTHTFARGGRLRAVKNTVKILTSNRDKLARKLLEPESSEPAIAEFARFGYDTASFNDRSPTSRTVVSNLNDASRLPGLLRRWAMGRVGPGGLLLEFRLDWLAARGVRALKAGEIIDPQTAVASVAPQTFAGLTANGSPLSDHDPIVIDVMIGS